MSRKSLVEDAGGDVDHVNDVGDNDARLTMTVDTVIPLLMENIAVLSDRATSVEEKYVALDELLYLVEGAWSMPIIGREVAYRVCDVLREQGGLDMLLSNINGRTSDSADSQIDDIIVLMSAIVLSQVASRLHRHVRTCTLLNAMTLVEYHFRRNLIKYFAVVSGTQASYTVVINSQIIVESQSDRGLVNTVHSIRRTCCELVSSTFVDRHMHGVLATRSGQIRLKERSHAWHGIINKLSYQLVSSSY